MTSIVAPFACDTCRLSGRAYAVECSGCGRYGCAHFLPPVDDVDVAAGSSRPPRPPAAAFGVCQHCRIH